MDKFRKVEPIHDRLYLYINNPSWSDMDQSGSLILLNVEKSIYQEVGFSRLFLKTKIHMVLNRLKKIVLVFKTTFALYFVFKTENQKACSVKLTGHIIFCFQDDLCS